MAAVTDDYAEHRQPGCSQIPATAPSWRSGLPDQPHHNVTGVCLCEAIEKFGCAGSRPTFLPPNNSCSGLSKRRVPKVAPVISLGRNAGGASIGTGLVGEKGSVALRLSQRVVVADEAVEAGDPVVERPCGRVVLFGRPIEPGTAALAGNCGDGFDQLGAAALPPDCRVDKQILQVADLAHHPG